MAFRRARDVRVIDRSGYAYTFGDIKCSVRAIYFCPLCPPPRVVLSAGAHDGRAPKIHRANDAESRYLPIITLLTFCLIREAASGRLLIEARLSPVVSAYARVLPSGTGSASRFSRGVKAYARIADFGTQGSLAPSEARLASEPIPAFICLIIVGRHRLNITPRHVFLDTHESVSRPRPRQFTDAAMSVTSRRAYDLLLAVVGKS